MDKVLAVTRNPCNRWHGTTIEAMVIIYNPEFKGQIAHADPARSGSAFMALAIQLMSMGGNTENGWNYMSSFVENLDGKVLFSSSAVFEQVADGSYKVGITYEEAALKYEKSGENLEVVYPAEGTSKVPGPIAIIKGAKNLEHAKKFVDFILSKEVQAMMGGIYRRTVRTDIVLPSHMVPNEKLGDIPYDPVWVGQNKDRLLGVWKTLFEGL